MENKIDFLAIGDITTDAFIRIEDASVHCNIDNTNCEICMRFGDKIPYESVEILRAVGNSPNASVSAARLGLKAAIITHIGNDLNGKECIETLQSEHVATAYVSTQDGKLTNYHYVLWYETDRTILIKHTEFEYILPKITTAPAWIYLSSLGSNSLPYHHEISAYLKAHPETKLAFQPGTFQMKLGTETLKELYAQTHVFFCNVEEAERILNIPSKEPTLSRAEWVKILMQKIHALGPKIVSITDGPAGAYASDGITMWYMPIYPDIAPPRERTGAGDAYASTFTAALALSKSVSEALAWGPINSMNVVQHIGAQKGLLSREKLEEYITKAPTEYKAKVI
ncbi:MAG: carbohydrate kinase family protein [Candidatus Pacebacteria bacterium]|jgi:ribokinase|nr:carbohydrate kinase family protein [Candidatus Paceibacterota bacterium]